MFEPSSGASRPKSNAPTLEQCAWGGGFTKNLISYRGNLLAIFIILVAVLGHQY